LCVYVVCVCCVCMLCVVCCVLCVTHVEAGAERSVFLGGTLKSSFCDFA